MIIFFVLLRSHSADTLSLLLPFDTALRESSASESQPETCSLLTAGDGGSSHTHKPSTSAKKIEIQKSQTRLLKSNANQKLAALLEKTRSR